MEIRLFISKKMISVQILTFTFILIAFVVFKEVSGIKCWVCRSDTDPKCEDPFDNSTVPISECTQFREFPHLGRIRPTMCRKIRQKVNGEWRYFRSCAYLGEPGIQNDERFCLMRTGTYNIFMEYCTCNSKDGCNTGAKHLTSSVLIIFSLATFLLAPAYRIGILC